MDDQLPKASGALDEVNPHSLDELLAMDPVDLTDEHIDIIYARLSKAFAAHEKNPGDTAKKRKKTTGATTAKERKANKPKTLAALLAAKAPGK